MRRRGGIAALGEDPHFAIGAWVPLVVVRVAVAGVGAALTPVVLSGGFEFVGYGLAALAAVLPATRAAWLLIACLALGAAASGGSPGMLAVLLLGVHVLHVVAAWSLVLPVRGRLQIAALGRPLLRLVLIQVPVQLTAALLSTEARTVVPATVWAFAGAAALLLVIVALVRAVAGAGRED